MPVTFATLLLARFSSLRVVGPRASFPCWLLPGGLPCSCHVGLSNMTSYFVKASKREVCQQDKSNFFSPNISSTVPYSAVEKQITQGERTIQNHIYQKAEISRGHLPQLSLSQPFCGMLYLFSLFLIPLFFPFFWGGG